jgi:hypothetical protein
MTSQFHYFPHVPTSSLCQNAYVILCNAHDAASSFLEAFQDVRKARRAKGMPTDEEQDLLRAMLLFASAGLDSLVKQLIRDALPAVLESNEAAAEMFKIFVERRLRTGEDINLKLLAQVIGDRNPRKQLIALQVKELTSTSLQSTEELLKAGAAFDIPSNELTTDLRRLTDVFRVRNQIAHEMDVDFTQPNRSRRPRARTLMEGHTNQIFRVANAFLLGVDGRVQ